MIKKILLGVLILGVIVFALIGYGTYKFADETLKEKEPQLRQYLQMDELAQNQYILDNIDELLNKVESQANDNSEDKAKRERLKQLNSQPEIQNALINVGRSLMASVIMLSEPIVNDMSPEIKAQYQKEADEFDARFDKYQKLVDAADKN